MARDDNKNDDVHITWNAIVYMCSVESAGRLVRIVCGSTGFGCSWAAGFCGIREINRVLTNKFKADFSPLLLRLFPLVAVILLGQRKNRPAKKQWKERNNGKMDDENMLVNLLTRACVCASELFRVRFDAFVFFFHLNKICTMQEPSTE